jgi:glycosyltransferase involved in cell wall biosynthesis
MHKAKNQVRLLSIFHAIAMRSQDARLLLVGDDRNEYGRCVRIRIHDLALDDRVVCAGVRTDIPRLLKASDLMIFPSLWEGLPGAVLEACIAGIPTLGSDLPGIREIAEEFPLVTIHSLEAPDAEWADAAERLSSENRAMVKSGAQGVTVAESRFSLQRSVETLCSIWGLDSAYA